MKLLALIMALSIGLAYALGGPAPFGRVLLAAGFPQLAAQVFRDDSWRGVALYRAGDYDAAAQAFAAAGDVFNLGNAEAYRGRYAAALEAFDQGYARGDPDARVNFDLVAAHYAGLGIDPDAYVVVPKRENGPQEDSFVARGNARASGSGTEATNNNTMMGLAELDSRGRLGVRRLFDDKFMIADERWLAQLADVPGEYMAARITEEHKRRVRAGIAQPDAEDPQ